MMLDLHALMPLAQGERPHSPGSEKKTASKDFSASLLSFSRLKEKIHAPSSYTALCEPAREEPLHTHKESKIQKQQNLSSSFRTNDGGKIKEREPFSENVRTPSASASDNNRKIPEHHLRETHRIRTDAEQEKSSPEKETHTITEDDPVPPFGLSVLSAKQQEDAFQKTRELTTNGSYLPYGIPEEAMDLDDAPVFQKTTDAPFRSLIEKTGGHPVSEDVHLTPYADLLRLKDQNPDDPFTDAVHSTESAPADEEKYLIDQKEFFQNPQDLDNQSDDNRIKSTDHPFKKEQEISTEKDSLPPESKQLNSISSEIPSLDFLDSLIRQKQADLNSFESSPLPQRPAEPIGLSPASPSSSEEIMSLVPSSAVSPQQTSPTLSKTGEASSNVSFPSVAQPIRLHIRQGIQKGLDELEFDLVPAELGRLKVKLHIDNEGRIMALVRADKFETYEFLKQDSSTRQALLQAFDESGFQANEQSLHFSFHDPSQKGNQHHFVESAHPALSGKKEQGALTGDNERQTMSGKDLLAFSSSNPFPGFSKVYDVFV